MIFQRAGSVPKQADGDLVEPHRVHVEPDPRSLQPLHQEHAERGERERQEHVVEQERRLERPDLDALAKVEAQ